MVGAEALVGRHGAMKPGGSGREYSDMGRWDRRRLRGGQQNRGSGGRGEPLVRCQLLASEFYEALKRELRPMSHLGVVERAMVVAAANQCRHAATAGISPGAMLGELRTAIALLRFSGLIPPAAGARPTLRIIEGGLSRVG
jgi:hypothetical protein